MSRRLLWIGAGAAQSFSLDYCEYSEIIFVDPLLQIDTKEQFRNGTKFKTVQKGVITESVGKQRFKLFNNDEFSSFLEPTGLNEVYPNLVVEEILDVETIDIVKLIKELQIVGSENTLILDLPCLSKEILKELKYRDIISLFHEIRVCAGKKPLFSGGSDINTITELLNDAFYQFVSECNSDIDICMHTFTFTPLLKKVHIQKKQILDLRAQIKLTVNKLKKLEKANAELKANEQSLTVELSEKKLRYKQSLDSYANELKEVKDREERQKEIYTSFARLEQGVGTLIAEVERIKRENSLLVSNDKIALAVSELEHKVTAMLNKQNEDSVEIANALGKHVTRCHEEQKSNTSSQLELRKLSAFSRVPISQSSYNMDSENLAELSSLVSQNVYDVIIEFGSGLSTVVTASALHDNAGRGSSKDKYLKEKGDNRELKSTFAKRIVTFEQSSNSLKVTNALLSIAGVDAYVDLCHAPLISVAHSDRAKGGGVFYDCTEKLLELKRILNNRNANVLAVVNGPLLDDDETARYFALPLVLECLSQSSSTFFINNTNSEQIRELVTQWVSECKGRHLTVNVQKIKTPKGVTRINIQS